jgi:hypothetical protein
MPDTAARTRGGYCNSSTNRRRPCGRRPHATTTSSTSITLLHPGTLDISNTDQVATSRNSSGTVILTMSMTGPHGGPGYLKTRRDIGAAATEPVRPARRIREDHSPGVGQGRGARGRPRSKQSASGSEHSARPRRVRGLLRTRTGPTPLHRDQHHCQNRKPPPAAYAFRA